jgi:D-serine deaminase-like pyridoxal phosphate-dependent protein
MRGQIVGLGDDVETVTHNEEHWRFRLTDASVPRPNIGDPLYVVPTHICPTVNLQTELQIVGSGARVEQVWSVDAHHRI